MTCGGCGTPAFPEDAWTVYIDATSDILTRRRRQWERLCTRLLTADSLSWHEAADILGRRDPYGGCTHS